MPDFNRRDLISTPAALSLLGPVVAEEARAAPADGSSPWRLDLCPTHGVALALAPRGLGRFSFVPRRRAPIPSGNYALGDIDLRVRADGQWQDLSSAFHRVGCLPSSSSAKPPSSRSRSGKIFRTRN